MRAVVIHAPKDLRIDNFPDPAPEAGQVRVKIAAGGICGSDLHYYHHGGFGTVRIKQPMALGHEIAGVIAAVGAGVTGLSEGTRVAVNPSLPCGHCAYCREGLRNQCLDMRFMGSAMRDPHVQGGFREFVTVDASQAVPIAPSLSLGEAAMAEPLSVCLHAAHQAGSLLGKRVLVTGCGPIGALSILVARYGGAAEIVATDVAEAPLAVARKLGASHAVNVAAEPAALDPWRVGKGTFDVLFEASGNQAALRAALDVMRAGGVIVQLGLGGEMTLPLNTLVTKELQLRGTFRFDREFDLAVRLMGEGLLDVKPLISATLPFQEAISAFELASDRSRAMKVHLTF
ncbi:L-idonate 5-dehydrogenase, NAD-binding [Bradyrhizobium sp. ORS 285]|uniref:L-idonate 5-dehydrogenase n=1 Tax=Bradyrhizobium sp. ORS 285 TaxID=115808 RepID=UPI0002406196|nr:L-idonate 5-dehydrogenase [Bradyrhizobium sp. ORS 285]CCD85448.1 L-idonate 5-dehydrogenase, NAD-binding [Bradyrhizobium sp. ORS 285]SMX60285.1 L-idonate 5-dehydrogenase, NAD-binding [Bradyrhizobium sp. ORS 285]